MRTAREIIDLFGYASLALVLDVPAGTVSAWKSRNAIPQPYWRKIAAEARRRRIGITYAAIEAAARPARRRRRDLIEAHA